MDGSSRTYIIHSSLVPIWVARRILWDSHQESVPARRASVIYSSPTPERNSSRSTIFLKIGFIICSSDLERESHPKKLSASSTLSDASSPIFLPDIFTFR